MEAPSRVWAATSRGVSALDPSGCEWRGSGVLLRFEDGRAELLESADPIFHLELVWSPGVPEGAKVLGDDWERSYGTLGWAEVDYHRTLPWYFAASANGETHAWGVQTGGNSLASWRVGNEGIRLMLDVRSGNRPLRLSGRSLALANVVWRQGERAFDTVRELCRRMCPNPRVPAHPTYGANDWYYAYGNNTPGRLLEDSQRTSDLSENPDNRPFSVIDAGWQLHGGAEGGGPWIGNATFPDMPGLAAGIAATGCQPGIWVRPLLSREDHPKDWLMGRESLDPSHPAVMEKVFEDIRTLHDWGYRLIKHDFTTFEVTGLWGFEMTDGMGSKGRTYADDTRTTAEILLGLYRTIREAAQDSLIIGCNTVGHLGAGLFEIQRIGDDTSGREWARTVKMGVNTLAFRGVQQGTFFEADADCVGLTTDIPWEQNRQWMDLVARSGTPLFVSAQKEALGPEQLRAMREAFAVASVRQPLGEPLNWMETRTPCKWQLGREEVAYRWEV